MYLLGLGLLLLALKFFALSPVAGWSWWLVLLPAYWALAFVLGIVGLALVVGLVGLVLVVAWLLIVALWHRLRG